MICISSVSKFCEDFSKIENYEKAINDTTQVWCCHHRLEISPMGNHFSRRYLIEQRLYYNQKPEALIFLTRSEHMKLHGKGKKFSEETKQKISKTLTGRHWKLVDGKRIWG